MRVAIAAVIGWAWFGLSAAGAAPFSIQIGAETGADGPISATLTGDTLSPVVRLDYYESNESADGLTFFSTTFLDPSATLSRSNVTSSTDGLGFTTKSLDVHVSDGAFVYTVTDLSGSSEQRQGYTFDFTLFQDIAPDGTIYQYESLSNKTVLGSVYDRFSSTTTVTGDPFSPVPLPGSLPLLGAALLALGGLRYGLGRRAPVAM